MSSLSLLGLSILLLAGLLISPSSTEIAEEEGVLVVTKNNFDEAIATHTHILVEFYAPWCGHCKSFAPEYSKAAEDLKSLNSEIKLAKVDATQETELAKRFNVAGYPTIKFFKGGEPQDYKGPRNANGIVEWLLKKTGPVSTTIDSEEELNEFKSKNEYCVIGFFEELDDKEAKTFSAVAEQIEDSPIGIVVDKELLDTLSITPDTIIAYRQYDAPTSLFQDEFSEENILLFIKIQKFRLVTDFSPKESEKLFDGTVNTHFLFFSPKGTEETSSVISDMGVVAETYRGKILIIHIDTNNTEYNSIVEFFGISQTEIPCVRIVTLSKEDVQRFKQPKSDLSQEGISTFINEFFEGKLSQDLKTEDVPDNWDENPVKILTSLNFDDVVNAFNKSAIIEFYAPWCGHCKALSPIWDKLGEHFIDDENIIVAKVDSTKNEIVGLPITGFPTIKYFPANSDDVIDYGGDRELNDFIRFVESDGKIGAKTEGDDEPDEPDDQGEALSEDDVEFNLDPDSIGDDHDEL